MNRSLAYVLSRDLRKDEPVTSACLIIEDIRYLFHYLIKPSFINDFSMISQAWAEMFCCVSLVLTRDTPSVEVWATERVVWSCRMVTGEGIPPSVEALAG